MKAPATLLAATRSRERARAVFARGADRPAVAIHDAERPDAGLVRTGVQRLESLSQVEGMVCTGKHPLTGRH